MRRCCRLADPDKAEMDEEPAYEIEITDSTGNASLCRDGIEQAVSATLRRHQVPHAQISIALVSDEEIAQLNERHLQHPGPTDVLTFDLGTGPKETATVSGPETRCPLPVEAQIVASAETAAREAASRGHSVEAELALYAVHGTLHLLGYDDKTEGDAVRMHRAEDEILASVGWREVYGVNPG